MHVPNVCFNHCIKACCITNVWYEARVCSQMYLSTCPTTSFFQQAQCVYESRYMLIITIREESKTYAGGRRAPGSDSRSSSPPGTHLLLLPYIHKNIRHKGTSLISVTFITLSATSLTPVIPVVFTEIRSR